MDGRDSRDSGDSQIQVGEAKRFFFGFSMFLELVLL